MCTPGLSSMMYKEYPKWEKQGKIIPMMKGALDIAKESGEEYPSSSKYFKEQIMNNRTLFVYGILVEKYLRISPGKIYRQHW